ncbi:MAG: hypothetical protein ACN2B6_11470 [Rickettsiales bacterium]
MNEEHEAKFALKLMELCKEYADKIDGAKMIGMLATEINIQSNRHAV